MIARTGGVGRRPISPGPGSRSAGWSCWPRLTPSRPLGLDRRDALWAVKGLKGDGARSTARRPSWPACACSRTPSHLPVMALPQAVAEDYRTTSLSLKAHPCGFFRPMLDRLSDPDRRAAEGRSRPPKVSVAGLVLIRQRPGTAKGVVFVTLEDETGAANAVVWKDGFDANRRTVMSASFLIVHGKVQKAAERRDPRGGRGLHRPVGRTGPRMKEDPEAPAPTVRMRTSGRLQRSRDFH